MSSWFLYPKVRSSAREDPTRTTIDTLDRLEGTLPPRCRRCEETFYREKWTSKDWTVKKKKTRRCTVVDRRPTRSTDSDTGKKFPTRQDGVGDGTGGDCLLDDDTPQRLGPYGRDWTLEQFIL